MATRRPCGHGGTRLYIGLVAFAVNLAVVAILTIVAAVVRRGAREELGGTAASA